MRQVGCALALAGSMLLIAAPAMAAPVYSTDFNSGVGPEWSTDGYNNGDANIYGYFGGGTAKLILPVSITGSSTVAFDLLPYASIDGASSVYTDTFSAYYNGNLLFSGIFGGGGGGSDSYVVPPGGSIVSLGNFNHRITLAFTAVAGVSTLEFTYGVLQGFSDEGWGLDNVVVDSTLVTGGVPEPASWALMIGGFALVGGAMRQRRAVRFA